LAANPDLRLHVQAYAAPFGTAEGRMYVSESRAIFVSDYYTQNYGIASYRITSEAFGAERVPERATLEWQSHRTAELILYEN
jgi:outer membrane protein OmpA-like peptidoglycan-associated protein